MPTFIRRWRDRAQHRDALARWHAACERVEAAYAEWVQTPTREHYQAYLEAERLAGRQRTAPATGLDEEAPPAGSAPPGG